jgi:hypothetical protein
VAPLGRSPETIAMITQAPSDREGPSRAPVGREEVVARLRAELDAQPAALTVIDVAGPDGIGKSALLARLADEARDAVTLAVALEAYAPARRGVSERDLVFKDIRLSEDFRLLRELARQLPAADRARFAGRLEELVSITAARKLSHLALESAAQDAAEAFAEVVRAQARPVVLLADDLGAVHDDHLERWLLLLLRELADAPVVAVVTRTSSGELPPRYPGRVLGVQVRPLDEAEVAAWLAAELGREPDAGVAERIAAWSGGYPIALRPAAAAARETQNPDDLRRRLDEPPRDLVHAMEPMLCRLRDAGGAAAAIVEIGAVVSDFDDQLLRTMLADLRVDPPADPRAVMAALPFVDEAADRYCFPEFFRRVVARDLARCREPQEGRSRLDTLHKHALDYFREQGQLALRGSTGYAAGSRFDRPDTQEFVLQEVRHAVALRDGASARLAFAAAYIDAFWWWPSSAFCARLLGDWEPRHREPEDEQLHRLLSTLQADYHSPRDDPDAARLEAAQCAHRALRGLPAMLGIAPVGDPTAKEAHVLAIIDTLIANELRLIEPASEEIDELYAEAYTLLSANRTEAALPRRRRKLEDDAWCIPWVLHYRADHARERKRLGAARDLLEEAFALARASGGRIDWEVLAECHRVLADVAFAQRAWDEAFEHYARATGCAYLFQSTQPLDTYTVEVYAEITGALLDRAYELARIDRAAAAVGCARVNLFWEPYWRECGERPPAPTFAWPRADDAYGRDRAAAALFPPPRPHGDHELEQAYIERLAEIERAIRRVELAGCEDVGGGGAPRLGFRRPSAAGLRGLAQRLRGDSSDAAEPVAGERLLDEDDDVWPGHWAEEGPRPWQRPEIDAELDGFLRAAIERMRPPFREVLRLRDVDGRSPEEVEAELDLSPAEQLPVLHRAQADLRAALDERYRPTAGPEA